MAKKPTQTKQQQQSIGEWVGFATIELTQTDREAIPAYADDWQHVEDVVAEMLQGDYKFTVKWDDRSDCFMLSISCYDAQSPNFKQTLVTRAPNIMYLYATAAYKHEIIARGVWGTNEASKWG